MKKISTIKINSKRIINDHELISIKGGYDGGCSCICYEEYRCYGYMAATSGEMCEDLCNDLGSGVYGVYRC